MKIRIVSDSASNLFELAGVDYVSVPMKIIANDKVYVDDPKLNVRNMMEELSTFRGKSNTSHPRIREWQEAFGDADVVFGVTVTGKLSGSYNSAVVAAEDYMEKNPGRQVFFIDSRSTGPMMALVIEKYKDLIDQGKSFNDIRAEIRHYMKRTHTWWALMNLQNFVNTGRVNAAAAAFMKIFGMVVVGSTNEGELEPTNKIKGMERANKKIYVNMLKDGFNGGRVRIHHSYNKDAAQMLADMIMDDYPDCDIKIELNKGLCGYYVEKGGLIVAFEG